MRYFIILALMLILNGCVTVAITPSPPTTPSVSPTASPTLQAITLPSVPLTLSYDELAHNTEQYVGNIGQLRGKVMKVILTDGQGLVLYIQTMDASDDEIIILHYEGANIKVGDIVASLYTVDGNTVYQDDSGAQQTAPELTAIRLSVD